MDADLDPQSGRRKLRTLSAPARKFSRLFKLFLSNSNELTQRLRLCLIYETLRMRDTNSQTVPKRTIKLSVGGARGSSGRTGKAG